MKRFTTTFLCMLAMSGLGQAWAQDDHGNTCQTGTTVDLNSKPLGILTANDTDVFLFQVPNPNALVTMSTIGETSTSGRLFQLVDGVPILLQEDWLSGGYNISQPLEEGTYCVEVIGRNTNVLGPYVLQMEADMPDDDHGNSCETATHVGKSDISGALTVFNDQDFFLVQISSANTTLTVSTLGETRTSGRLFQLVDGVPILLQEDWLSGGYDMSQPLGAGTYCIEVIGRNTDVLGPYVLQIAGDFIPAGSCSGTSVSLSTLSLDLGTIAVGKLSAPQGVVMTNSGAGQLFIDASALAGANAVEFGILNDTCAGRVLQPGEQCTLKAIFAPLGEGPKTASVTIPCNDLDSLPLGVKLAGTGIVPPVQ